MTDCEICNLLKTRKGLIYEDDKVAALLSPSPAAIGHLLVTSKKHFTIIEDTPAEILGQALNVANKLSMLVFEGLGAHGTNIIIENGESAGQKHAHILVNIIPRKENDGLNLQWPTKELSEDELNTAELKLKELSNTVGIEEKAKATQVVEEVPTEEIKSEDGKDDYRTKHLERLP